MHFIHNSLDYVNISLAYIYIYIFVDEVLTYKIGSLYELDSEFPESSLAITASTGAALPLLAFIYSQLNAYIYIYTLKYKSM